MRSHLFTLHFSARSVRGLTPTGSVLLGLGGLLAGIIPASAGTSILSDYTRTGVGETVTAPFASVFGTSTQFSGYLGPVEIVVSGTGVSNTPHDNDAFYDVSTQTVDGRGNFQLNIGTNAAPYQGDSASNISKDIIFIDGVGAVMPGTVPAYTASHVYDFVIQVPDAAPTPLTFGVADGIFGDNTGAYTVRVYPLAALPPSVPESSSRTLLGLGVLGLGGLFLRRRKLGAP